MTARARLTAVGMTMKFRKNQSAQEFLFGGGEFGVGEGAAMVEVGETRQLVGQMLIRPTLAGQMFVGKTFFAGIECGRRGGVRGGGGGGRRCLIVVEVLWIGGINAKRKVVADGGDFPEHEQAFQNA